MYRHPTRSSPQWRRRIADRISVHAGRDRSAQGHQQNPERPDRTPEEPPSPRHCRLGGMDHRKARRMDRLRLSSPTWTNHLPHGNGSLPTPRIWPGKRVDTLVRTQGPITTGRGLWYAASAKATKTSRNHYLYGVWVPAFAGTTIEMWRR